MRNAVKKLGTENNFLKSDKDYLLEQPFSNHHLSGEIEAFPLK